MDDLSGHSFNKWTVLHHGGVNAKGRTQWYCQCECGNEANVEGTSLTSGASKSCGCGRIQDIAGQTFGSWTVVSYAGKNARNLSSWNCRCVCGTPRIIDSSYLKNPLITSCGCHKLASLPDFVGKTFNRWTVLSYVGNNKHDQRMWHCRCECGKEGTVRSTALMTGSSKSCGCLAREKSMAAHRKHGLHDHPLYAIWWAMKDRCYKSHHPSFHRYGGRGITICDEWLNSFIIFYNWAMDNGYEKGLTLDRENNDLGYTPNNCRWTTSSVQMQNTSRTVITADQVPDIRNDPRSHSVIAKEYGVAESSISRIKARKTWTNIE